MFKAILYQWKRQTLIDAGRAEGVKSFEADELAQAHETIAELEAELEITRAAVAIFNGEEPVGQKAVPGRRRPEQSGLHRARGVSGRQRLAQLFLRVQVPRAERPRDPPAPRERPRGRHPQALAGHIRDVAYPAALIREQNMIVNKKLILSIMRELGIKGLLGPKRRVKNLVNQATEEDLVQRNFVVDRPNVLWLTDITEHPTREGKVSCCVVLDAFSRRVVGWAIDRRCETALVNDAVVMAADSRTTGPGSIIHSDHGASSPRGASASSSARGTSSAPWAPSATATTTPPWRASGGRCRSSCSTARSGGPRSSCRSPSPSGLSTSTTPSASTALWVTVHRWSLRSPPRNTDPGLTLTRLVRKMGSRSIWV